MLKILTADQFKKADLATIQNEPISSIELMERAATSVFNSILKNYSSISNSFCIFCGQGNNGGDGLVLARLLHEHGMNVKVYILQLKKKGSTDFEQNLKLLQNVNVSICYLTEKVHDVELTEKEIIIDAIFGNGLNKPIRGFIKEVVQKINAIQCIIIAVDIPSGLFSEDNSNQDEESIIKANTTYTFESPKLSFLFPENFEFVGEWKVLPIGLDKKCIASLPVANYLLQLKDAVSILKIRSSFDHKGTFGHSLVIAGSYGKMGAAVLCAKASLRTGTGLLSVYIPKCGYEIMQVSVPEAMAIVDEADHYLENHLKLGLFSSIGIGPGIGTLKETANVLKVLIQNSTQPIVLDADALNILAENKTWLSFLPPHTILTPHPGEFERLVGKWKNDFERYELLRKFSMKYKVIIVLKGFNTSIATPSGNIYFNSTGNPGMATGGSGDALTGMITSLLAQSYSAQEAVLLAVYLHGLAGDIAADKVGEHSLLASDIIENIPTAFLRLKNEVS